MRGIMRIFLCLAFFFSIALGISESELAQELFEITDDLLFLTKKDITDVLDILRDEAVRFKLDEQKTLNILRKFADEGLDNPKYITKYKKCLINNALKAAGITVIAAGLSYLLYKWRISIQEWSNKVEKELYDKYNVSLIVREPTYNTALVSNQNVQLPIIKEKLNSLVTLEHIRNLQLYSFFAVFVSGCAGLFSACLAMELWKPQGLLSRKLSIIKKNIDLRLKELESKLT